ncbi:MAG: HNH endonuclease signature motif containing protein [Arenicellales bacterium]|jgi:hypothetical protein|nr:HNH endonuclease signature motif containing protein [Arenicellales bacterium]MDP6531939.1 HNH endonuclease signature motif containing protein [Arenicellales bacterium]|tara:strand:- start:2735 stop:3805 length:1071 start_codon:yes stop_codon:yes gene_type:complete
MSEVLIPLPSPRQQVEFLQNIQRLLSEGQFTATYKFALLHALADICVEKGCSDGRALEIHTREIAEKFIQLYWRQAKPFTSSRVSAHVLRQNNDRPAAVLRRIEEALQQHHSLASLKQDQGRYRRLVTAVNNTVKQQPLWKLQRLGNDRIDYFYTNRNTGSSITLNPGIGYCFANFHSLVADLARAGWLRYIRRHNSGLLGGAVDLESFLFGTERSNLEAYVPLLTEIQAGQCFYCRQSRHRPEEVDHFIPWARYPVDLGHNFVLAHKACNGAKSDHLAAESHLEHWLQLQEDHNTEMIRHFDSEGLTHNLSTTRHVAAWAYRQTSEVDGQVWQRASDFVPLRGSWRDMLATHLNY